MTCAKQLEKLRERLGEPNLRWGNGTTTTECCEAGRVTINNPNIVKFSSFQVKEYKGSKVLYAQFNKGEKYFPLLIIDNTNKKDITKWLDTEYKFLKINSSIK